MPELGTQERPLRVAIVGSGPSGFYAADALLKSDTAAQVDVFECLPSPFGLVRFGVAPDHPKIKNVIRVYEKTAANEAFGYFGNVDVGNDITLDELHQYYDAILFAVGAATDRKLNISGEDLEGSHTATEFVAWYNGHPDYRDRRFDLNTRIAVIIGQGNVAVDVARILCKTTAELAATDIADHALRALAASKIEEIYMIGRRGPAQAAFTEPEIKEMGELLDCGVDLRAEDLKLNDASRAEIEDPANKRNKNNVEILEAYLARDDSARQRRLKINFFQSPTALHGARRVERVTLERNALSGDPGRQKARGTGKTEDLACGIFFRSVGYRGVPLDGVPFDEDAGTFANEQGRIVGSAGTVIPGLYCTGWIKRGPSGVIGTNRPDSAETVAALLADCDHLAAAPRRDSGDLYRSLRERGVRVVNYEDWKRIDAAEIEAGRAAGKPREKFTRVADMLSILGDA